MSIDIELDSVDVNIDGTNVSVEADKEVVTAANVIEPCIEERESIVEGYKKEYSIVGDGLYASVSAEEAPQWLLGLIESVTSTAIANGFSDADDLRTAIQTALSELDIAKNQYQELINIEATIEGVIASRLATLNATVDANSANIAELAVTKATPEEASALAASAISASLLDGDIRSEVNRIDNAVSTLAGTTATSIDAVESLFIDQQAEIEGYASATNSLYTYVGVDYDGNSTSTGLIGDIEILQKQNDGVIETIADTYDVMLNEQDGNPDTTQLVTTAEPYATWKAADDAAGNEDTRLAHIGDVYIKYQTTASGGKEYLASYKFVKTIPDETSPFATDAEGYTWTLIVDQAAQLAYTEALNAYDLADGKRTVYAGSTTPELQGYIPEERDIWIPEVTVDGYEEGNVYIYTGSTWDLATKTFVPIKVEDFESGLDNWTATANDTVSLETTDVYKGSNSALFTSNDTSAGSSGATGGTYIRVLDDGTITAGKKVLVELYAKQPSVGASTEFGVAYSTNSVGNSGWNTFTPTTSWEKYSFTFNVSSTNTNEDYLGIWGDTSGLGGSVLVDDIKVKVESTANLDAFVDTIYKENLNSLQDQLDGKIDTYYQNSAPYPNGTNDPNKDGDLWYDLDDNRLYVYRNDITTWTEVQDQTAIDAVNAAATAQATADGKITSYYIDTFSSLTALSNGWTTQEKSDNTGDLGVVYADADDENNTTWRWSGSNWVTTRDKKLVALASDVTNLSTELTNGTNTWASADSTLENSLSTAISDGDAVVESKFAYNSSLTLNGTTYNSGFGLATSLTDASIPVGESEFWIKADETKIIDPTTGVSNITFSTSTASGLASIAVTDGSNDISLYTEGDIYCSGSAQVNSTLTVIGVLSGTTALVDTLGVGVGTAANTAANFGGTTYGIQAVGSQRGGTFSTSSTTSGDTQYGVYSTATNFIGTDLSVGGYFKGTNQGGGTNYGVQAIAVSTASGATCSGVQASASSTFTSAYGVNSTASGAAGYGVVGSGNAFDFYASGSGTNYGPFTGSHECIVSDYLQYDIGDIIVDYKFVNSRNISNTIFKALKSSCINEPAIGVMNSTIRRKNTENVSALSDTNLALSETEAVTTFNAVGEGQVNVCGEGGNLSNGDLIVTSSIPGKGMRQNKEDGTPDDVIRNITVAKVRGDWEFSSPDEIKMVPCIYLCG